MRHPLRTVAATLMLLLGLIWIGQGIGLIGGSFMSGQSSWVVVGAILVAAAVVLAWTTRRATQG